MPSLVQSSKPDAQVSSFQISGRAHGSYYQGLSPCHYDIISSRLRNKSQEHEEQHGRKQANQTVHHKPHDIHCYLANQASWPRHGPLGLNLVSSPLATTLGPARFELATSSLSATRSSQLSYEPEINLTPDQLASRTLSLNRASRRIESRRSSKLRRSTLRAAGKEKAASRAVSGSGSCPSRVSPKGRRTDGFA